MPGYNIYRHIISSYRTLSLVEIKSLDLQYKQLFPKKWENSFTDMLTDWIC